jgi:hypothetical protein
MIRVYTQMTHYYYYYYYYYYFGSDTDFGNTTEIVGTPEKYCLQICMLVWNCEIVNKNWTLNFVLLDYEWKTEFIGDGQKQ